MTTFTDIVPTIFICICSRIHPQFITGIASGISPPIDLGNLENILTGITEHIRPEILHEVTFDISVSISSAVLQNIFLVISQVKSPYISHFHTRQCVWNYFNYKHRKFLWKFLQILLTDIPNLFKNMAFLPSFENNTAHQYENTEGKILKFW